MHLFVNQNFWTLDTFIKTASALVRLRVKRFDILDRASRSEASVSKQQCHQRVELLIIFFCGNSY